jgi:hypothetical protein
MGKTPRGITPENLEKLIAHIKGLPSVEPATIQAFDAINENKAVFRAAMDKGYSRDQLVDMWNEYGSAIKAETFGGHLRKALNPQNIAKKGKSAKVKAVKANKIEPHNVKEPERAEDPELDSSRNADRDASASNIDAIHIPKAAQVHTEASENALIDEILAKQNAANGSGSEHG